ncbi:MAG: hypothetical protein JXB43_02775 [Dehalococcoidia bacterium]|nr:hypothetical protein [Dehalococcoidia bacterium]
MNIPTNYIGCAFDWLFVLLFFGGYFYVLSRTGKKWIFMLLFGAAWLVMGISYIFLLTGTAASEGLITLIRTLGYLLFTSAILTAIAELTKSAKKNK